MITQDTRGASALLASWVCHRSAYGRLAQVAVALSGYNLAGVQAQDCKPLVLATDVFFIVWVAALGRNCQSLLENTKQSIACKDTTASHQSPVPRLVSRVTSSATLRHFLDHHYRAWLQVGLGGRQRDAEVVLEQPVVFTILATFEAPFWNRGVSKESLSAGQSRNLLCAKT
jgi:hypothetical protein